MDIVLSIKPEFSQLILKKKKKYELRKKVSKNLTLGSKVFLYETSPSQSIVGYFLVEDILFENVLTMWDKYHEDFGIDFDRYSDYFANQASGYAIKIGRVYRFKESKRITDIKGFGNTLTPPQSFIYAPNNLLSQLSN
jgi:predicted transcriptional regulator